MSDRKELDAIVLLVVLALGLLAGRLVWQFIGYAGPTACEESFIECRHPDMAGR